jgi:uncharacterized protein
MLPYSRAKQFASQNSNFTSQDMVIFAVLKTQTIGYLIYDVVNSKIKDIFVEPEFRQMNIGKYLISNILLFNPNLQGIDCEFFYAAGFYKKDEKILVDVNKLDLIESPYIVKYNTFWYNTFTGAIIQIKKNEIGNCKLELFKLGFLIPVQSDYSVIFEYFLKDVKSKLPNSATIVVTDACNLSCSYCFEKNKSRTIINDRNILNNTWEKIVPRIKSNFRLNFFGGEPLLNQDAIFYFTNKLRDYSIKQNINYKLGMITNGTLVTETFLSFFNDDEFEHIQITLDGIKELHDVVRGGFDKILLNSKKLLRISKCLGIRINITKNNYDTIKDLLLYLNNYFLKTEKKKITLSLGFVYDPDAHIHISSKKYSTILKYIIKNNFFGFNFFKMPKNKIFICSASTNNSAWFSLDNSEFICEHLVGNNNLIVSDYDIYYSTKCVLCQYYPVCGGPCWMADKNKEPIKYKCALISESVKYYVNKYTKSA